MVSVFFFFCFQYHLKIDKEINKFVAIVFNFVNLKLIYVCLNYQE